MAFNPVEIAEHTALIEEMIWSKRRPPLHLRDKVREGQRIEGSTVELFMVRPRFSRPQEYYEAPIAKARYVKTQKVWLVFWQRADLKWHRYAPQPEVKSLSAFLALVQADEYSCFWG